MVTTTDASRAGSFKLVLATEPSRALAKAHQYDINDQWNIYGASTKLTDLRAAATFCFAADHERVSLEADRYLGLAANCNQYVEGGSCCLIRSKKRPGGSGCPWEINPDGTLSPKKNKDLVLGFGPITYDSWNRRKQTEDWVAIGLVAPTSAQRLVVSSTATTTSMTLVEQVEVFKCELADLATACMSAHRLVVRSTNTTMAATAPDDEMAITQPAAMSIERESAKDVISAKSLHGCSGDLFVYAVWICGPGFSCIGPHPSAPDSEDVYARRALHGPPMCAYVTTERWERVDRTNTFRRTEGNGGCCAGDNNRKHHVTRACCCCHLHCYHVMDALASSRLAFTVIAVSHVTVPISIYRPSVMAGGITTTTTTTRLDARTTQSYGLQYAQSRSKPQPKPPVLQEMLLSQAGGRGGVAVSEVRYIWFTYDLSPPNKK